MEIRETDTGEVFEEDGEVGGVRDWTAVKWKIRGGGNNGYNR